MAYAWIITKDHLSGPQAEDPEPKYDGTGTIGPRQAPDAMCDALTMGLTPPGAEMFTFRMYDDDGILYYTGRLATTEGATERACYAPLGDYGRPNAGCVVVKYHGHPEMDCG